jgi:hypothetical protein
VQLKDRICFEKPVPATLALNPDKPRDLLNQFERLPAKEKLRLVVLLIAKVVHFLVQKATAQKYAL